MKKILYLMGIDWYWIKQRPQIIAEMLSKDYDVTVVYQKEIFQKISLRKDNDELEKSFAMPVMPYRDKNRVAYAIQKILFKWIISNINDFDIVWIGHPLLYRYIPSRYQGKLVYDCMDNHIALCNDAKIEKTISQSEKELMNRADLVFVSSNSIKDKLERKYKRNSILVRNGFNVGTIRRPQILSCESKIKIGYFGTIAEWIDFPLLIRSLEKINELEYYFWGPVSTEQIPQHPRLFFGGVVEHSELWDKAKDMDSLIMPFKINDIIEDVDPVKLYEYVSMGKVVITPYYKEIERFAPFVHFYHNEEELIMILNKLQKGELVSGYTDEQQDKFLTDNTWNQRCEIIQTNLLRIDREESCRRATK